MWCIIDQSLALGLQFQYVQLESSFLANFLEKATKTDEDNSGKQKPGVYLTQVICLLDIKWYVDQCGWLSITAESY